MSTAPKPDPFTELRNLLSENARLRARVQVLEHQVKTGHAPQDHNALNDACEALGCPVGVNRVDWLTTFAKALTLKADTDEADDLAEESLEICRILGIDVGGDYDLIATLRELVTQRDNLLSGAQRVTEALAKAKMLQAKDTWHQDAAGAIRAFVNLLAETTQWQKEGHRAEADLARIATYAGLSENATAGAIIAQLDALSMTQIAETRAAEEALDAAERALQQRGAEPEPPKVNNPAPKADFSILACAHPEALPWLVAREFGALTERIVVLERRVDNLVCEIAALKGGR